jgi:hypothetical protein
MVYAPGQRVLGVLTLELVFNVTGKTHPGPVGPESQFTVYGETPPVGATLIDPLISPLHNRLVGVVTTDKAAGLPTTTEAVEMHPYESVTVIA